MSKAIITLKDGKAMTVKLDEVNAPISVANFVKLAKDGFYEGLIFHRVIKNFMIQGGGFNVDMMTKKASTIKGEFAQNGVKNLLKHKAGTLSMARTSVPDSASSQFFICSVDTPHLDGAYAAFGQIEGDGMSVVDSISNVKTGRIGYYEDVPCDPIIIKTIEIVD